MCNHAPLHRRLQTLSIFQPHPSLTYNDTVCNHAYWDCRQSHAGAKYLEAVEALKGVNAELEQLRQQTGNFDWDAESASLERAKAQLHDLDKQASSISGELSGLGKVSASQQHASSLRRSAVAVPAVP